MNADKIGCRNIIQANPLQGHAGAVTQINHQVAITIDRHIFAQAAIGIDIKFADIDAVGANIKIGNQIMPVARRKLVKVRPVTPRKGIVTSTTAQGVIAIATGNQVDAVIAG